MEDVNFWEEDLKPDNPCDNVKQLMQKVDRLQIAIQESSLDDDSRDVATTIAGYISKKLQTRSKCTSCSKMLIADKDGIENDKYLNILSRGRMTVPSTDLADFVDDCFAILDYISPLLVEHNITNVRTCAHGFFIGMDRKRRLCAKITLLGVQSWPPSRLLTFF